MDFWRHFSSMRSSSCPQQGSLTNPFQMAIVGVVCLAVFCLDSIDLDRRTQTQMDENSCPHLPSWVFLAGCFTVIPRPNGGI